MTVTAVCNCRQVLELLQVLHNADIVHRDLRPDNLVFYKVGSRVYVMLIDWAFACPRNEWRPYCGATHFVSPTVAAHLINRYSGSGSDTYCFTAGDDLHSWLRLCLWMSNERHLSDALGRIEVAHQGEATLAPKQRHIKHMFDKQLATTQWAPLAAAVNTIAASVAQAGGVRVDYSTLHKLIPLNEELEYKLIPLNEELEYDCEL
jgi:serine/threonine protein kinase